MSTAEMYRVTGTSSRMLTPYTSEVQQTFSWMENLSYDRKGAYNLNVKRWFGADYAVVGAKTNKLGSFYSQFSDEQYYLFDYRNNAVFELSPQENYACKFVAQSTINPQLVRPDVIANFTNAQKPRTIYPDNLLLEGATMKLLDSEQGQKAVYTVPRYEMTDERELNASRSGLSPVSARYRYMVKGKTELDGRYEARVMKSPEGFPFDVAKKLAECRQALPRGGVTAVLQAIMARTDKVVGYELTPYYQAARVYFAGTPKEWVEAMRGDFKVSESLEAKLTLPNGARLQFYGHKPKVLFDAQGNRVDGIVVPISIQ